jgi:hypothetical protein
MAEKKVATKNALKRRLLTCCITVFVSVVVAVVVDDDVVVAHMFSKIVVYVRIVLDIFTYDILHMIFLIESNLFSFE